jgi:MFS family permease
VRRPVAALAVVFFLLGFLGGSWPSRVPAISGSLGLSNGVLGLALLGLPVGSVGASLLLPALIRRYGASRMVAGGVLATAATVVVPAAAGGPATLAGGLLLLGAASGALDVAMNDVGVSLQARLNRSVFGRLHAMWSLGSFAASAVGALVANAGISPLPHLAVVAVGALLLAAWPVRVVTGSSLRPPGGGLDSDAGDAVADHSRRSRAWSADPRVLALAFAALAAFVVEVVAGDWGGVYLRRSLGAAPGLAAGAYAAFALPHFLVRVFGDPLVDRLHRGRLLSGGLLAAATGYAALVAANTSAVALAGLAVAGAGVGLVVPVAFAAAGAVPGVRAGAGVATAAGLGYLGWTASPPLVGGLAAAAGLRWALLLPAAVALGGALAVRLGAIRRRGCDHGV